jgi:hypothetical protein
MTTETPTFRDRVLMKLIDMGLGMELSRGEERLIDLCEDNEDAPSLVAKDICIARGWPA